MLIHEDIDWSETYALSETYANVGDKLMMIPGYNIIWSNRPSFGGGVAILHNSEINCDLLSETDFTDLGKSDHKTNKASDVMMCLEFQWNSTVRGRPGNRRQGDKESRLHGYAGYK